MSVSVCRKYSKWCGANTWLTVNGSRHFVAYC